MLEYKAPVKDIQFILHDVLNIMDHYKSLPGTEEVDRDLVDAITSECAKFCEQVLSPLYQVGDEEGCKLEDGKVTTPTGFKEAYHQFVEAGWQGLSHPTEYGGQGLPLSLNAVKLELTATANWPWAMYPGLSVGAMNTLVLHGSEEQKQTYLTKLIDGSWSGTMCLTEPHCGTDLGQVKTRAELNADGSYSITGTKIFISAGDHDFTDNIVHIVLARTPDAPKGTKGISLFIVPKHLPAEDDSTGEFNNVVCSGLEHKMGIKASTTCVMNFEGAKGFLVGPENKGLNCMFTFMNSARIGTGAQGYTAAELSFQGALKYAKERMSMRSLSGKKRPNQVADFLIDHPDVRRMLLTQKAIAEGGRAMTYYTSKLADFLVVATTEEEREKVDDQLGLLTPIVKGFITELGLEATNLGVQIYGGHGYIREWGMEQIVRDTRIATLYEGTTGIQALDLLGRKILLGRAKTLKVFTNEIRDFAKQYNGLGTSQPIRGMAKQLTKINRHWWWLSLRVMAASMKDRDAIGSASVDYLMFSGYVFMAYMWLQMAVAAQKALDEKSGDEDFYKAKIQTAEFYYARLLPRAEAHARSMIAPASTLMNMKDEDFSLTA